MGRFFDLVTEPVRLLGSYPPAVPAPRSQTDTALLKLNANESPYGPSLRAVAAMREALEGSHLYPDDGAVALRRKLAEVHGLAAEHFLISNGTTALLASMARALLRPGLKAVTSACSFIVYPMAVRTTGATLVETPLRDGGYDLAAIRAAIDEDTRLLFLANPNNPTGTLLEAAHVDQFLKDVPPHVIVVIDEAYYDYAQHFARGRGVEYSHALDCVRSDKNIVVLRTFSKAHGLAGIRIGYGIGPAELMTYVARMQDMFAVSSVAQAAALAAVDDEMHVRYAVGNNARQAEWLTAEIAKLGFSAIPTWANFLFFDVKQDAREFARRLRQEGVLIQPLNAWGAPTALRVTIGNADQNQKFVQALRKLAG
jgi:histidinol-phosphate aminotransferase